MTKEKAEIIQIEVDVAKEVTGFEYPRHRLRPKYARNMSDAWKVVEAIRERGYSVHIATNECADEQNGVLFQEGYKNLGKRLLRPDYELDELTVEATVPLAICRAALKAVRTEETEEA